MRWCTLDLMMRFFVGSDARFFIKASTVRRVPSLRNHFAQLNQPPLSQATTGQSFRALEDPDSYICAGATALGAARASSLPAEPEIL